MHAPVPLSPPPPAGCRLAADSRRRRAVAIARRATGTRSPADSRSCRTRSSRRCTRRGCASRDTGWQPRYPHRVERRRAGRRDAALREDALLRRVRVRLGLGRRLSPPRPPLLPEARRGDSVHAGARAAAARRRRRRRAARCSTRALGAVARGRLSRRCTCCSPTTTRPREGAAAGMIDARRRAVPLAQPPATATSTTSSPRSSTTSARRSGRSGASSREAGVTFVRKTGAEITRRGLARSSSLLRGAPIARITRRRTCRSTFFDELARRCRRQRAAGASASATARRLCAALDVFDATTLWGRYWGTREYVPGLHFEACYYQAIEFCIERGIARFEGGAQGVHKLARGLLPVATHSLHAIARSRVRRPRSPTIARASASTSRMRSTSSRRAARFAAIRPQTADRSGLA